MAALTETRQRTTTRPTATSPGAAVTDVLSTALELVTAKAARKADEWTDKLEGIAAAGIEEAADVVEGELDAIAEGGGAKQQAVVKGFQAILQGKNPIWAAIKGAWSGNDTKIKAIFVAAVVALVLLLLLSPVLLLVLLLGLLIAAVVLRARSAKN